MAVYKIFPTKDATLYSQYNEMNTGLDEIIESFDSKLFDFNIKNQNQFGNYNLDHIN